MYQFFVEPSQIQGNRIVIAGGDFNHIRNVLRMKAGEEIAVSNGVDGREYRCGIESFSEKEVICSLRFIKEEGVELPSRIYLFQGLPKSDKMELIVQKAVELGACEIIPVATGRAVVRLDEKKAKAKTARWQGIAEAAAKQSRRSIIPAITEVMSMQEAIAYAGKADVRLIPYELAENMAKTKEIIGGIRPGESVAVFIGPEGGFEEKEVAAAMDGGCIPITLGKRILRTETAGFTVLSWLMYHLEE
ncbi:MAG: 16S rRNA (uracil(1498)-N(3))-methyltransferase [Blautia sp.]|nr:16S rRNA (uracil(1498)-N(3))-methyltransferase [Blautia sp.]MCM1201303.1 16S rRNA (uracil(1498)-N(3))-methyltransferase [Bacteroides fragilis]